ncbi:MAG: RlmE family RNA methyltransferase [Betaproteobacteria bacterium]|nr:MAG: RlmE family RNA methyltransferase [Betaproteobacteria bacterium]
MNGKNSPRTKNRSKREWIRRHLADPFVQAATREGYRSRAAYKLIEIDQRDRLIRAPATVVELGAAPGSWTQVIVKRLSDRAGRLRGRVIALDLLPIEPIEGVERIEGDFREEAVERRLAEALQGRPADLIVSDMSPNLSGIEAADAARSQDLCELTLRFALNHLRPGGDLLVKTFHASGYGQYVQQLKKRFKTVSVRKPAASRPGSAEVYLLARGLKPDPDPVTESM